MLSYTGHSELLLGKMCSRLWLLESTKCNYAQLGLPLRVKRSTDSNHSWRRFCTSYLSSQFRTLINTQEALDADFKPPPSHGSGLQKRSYQVDIQLQRYRRMIQWECYRFNPQTILTSGGDVSCSAVLGFWSERVAVLPKYLNLDSGERRPQTLGDKTLRSNL